MVKAQNIKQRIIHVQTKKIDFGQNAKSLIKIILITKSFSFTMMTGTVIRSALLF